MKDRARVTRGVGAAIGLATVVALACARTPTPDEVAAEIRSLERQRLQALVAGDTTVAGPLHAGDFQLINPFGQALSRKEYLGGVASGALDYQVWEPDQMAIHLDDITAVIRYQARLSIVVQGDTVPEARYWHTDMYQKNGKRWQVVWSQATAIR